MISLGPPAIYKGTFMGARLYSLGKCQVMLSGEQEIAENGWHFSISHPNRYPTWDEQKQARYQLCPAEITMASYLPPMSEFVNIHENCFHWWEVKEGQK